MTETATTVRPRRRSRVRLLLFLVTAGWLLIGLTIAAIVGFELGLQALFAIKDSVRPLPLPDPRVVAEGYAGASWTTLLYTEQASLEAEWAPYVEFRLKPFRGQHTHITPDHERLTWRPEATSDPAGEVLVLGGSSAWGMGARDLETIPSHLAQVLADAGQPVRVRNAAQIGHVQTQGLIELEQRLLRGERPRVVVFYDGVNDVLAALQNGKAGWPQNAANRRAEFNLLGDRYRLLKQLAVATAGQSSLARLADSAARRLSPVRQTSGSAGKFDDELAQAVVERCAANLSQIDALAARYGFVAVCCWQPVLFTKREITGFEQEKTLQYAWLKQPFELVRQRLDVIAAADTSRVVFLDLAAILDNEPGLVYTDFCHTTELPNRRIAQAIAGRIIEVMKKSSAE